MTSLSLYRAWKISTPQTLRLIRMGDFYEAFDNDADIIAKALGLVITKRGDAPMCGVPAARLAEYLDGLNRLGHAVTVIAAGQQEAAE